MSTPRYWQCPNDEGHSLRFGEKIYGTSVYRQYCTKCPDTEAIFKSRPAAPTEAPAQEPPEVELWNAAQSLYASTGHGTNEQISTDRKRLKVALENTRHFEAAGIVQLEGEKLAAAAELSKLRNERDDARKKAFEECEALALDELLLPLDAFAGTKKDHGAWVARKIAANIRAALSPGAAQPLPSQDHCFTCGSRDPHVRLNPAAHMTANLIPGWQNMPDMCNDKFHF